MGEAIGWTLFYWGYGPYSGIRPGHSLGFVVMWDHRLSPMARQSFWLGSLVRPGHKLAPQLVRVAGLEEPSAGLYDW